MQTGVCIAAGTQITGTKLKNILDPAMPLTAANQSNWFDSAHSHNSL
jgi:hypothetical protein